jgi:hypothetical protein
MYLQKGISIKTQRKKLLFVAALKVTDEKSRIWSHADSFVKGTNPRIRIRIQIHTKMSRIWNASSSIIYLVLRADLHIFFKYHTKGLKREEQYTKVLAKEDKR